MAVLLAGGAVFAQTTEYTTGQTYTDAWTGWSTPVVTNISGSSVNGAYVYAFSGSTSDNYTIEIYRQFTINTNDIDIYFAATTQNATVSVEYSTDNVSYSQIGTQNWGAGFAQSTMVIPTYDPVVSTFYLKLKMSGTFGSPAQAQFNNLRIDAVLNSSGAAVEEFELGSNVLFANGELQVIAAIDDYTVSIYDISGKLIVSQLNLKSYNLAPHNEGIYFVSILNNGLRKTIKIAHTK